MARDFFRPSYAGREYLKKNFGAMYNNISLLRERKSSRQIDEQ